MKTLIFTPLILLALIAGYMIIRSDTSPMTDPVAVPAVTAEPIASTDMTPQPLLHAADLSGVAFGTPTDAAIVQLTAIFGTPTKDTGTIGSFSEYGTCPGKEIRVVEWNSLRTIFGDSTYGKGAFFHYEYMKKEGGVVSPLLATDKGITLDATKAQLLAAYPDATIDTSVPDYQFFKLGKGTGKFVEGILYNGAAVSWLSGGIACGD